MDGNRKSRWHGSRKSTWRITVGDPANPIAVSALSSFNQLPDYFNNMKKKNIFTVPKYFSLNSWFTFTLVQILVVYYSLISMLHRIAFHPRYDADMCNVHSHRCFTCVMCIVIDVLHVNIQLSNLDWSDYPPQMRLPKQGSCLMVQRCFQLQ